MSDNHETPVAKAARRDGPTPLGGALWAGLHVAGLIMLLALAAGQVRANDSGTAEAATAAFAAHCFSPYMTADRAEDRLAMPGVRVDFYDLTPFSNAAPSPVTGRAATAGTDRRCEVAFDGDHADLAREAAIGGLASEGIDSEAPVPDRYQPTAGTELLAARFLNPNRIAVVHVGTRPGPDGVETFMTVERLTPSDQQ